MAAGKGERPQLRWHDCIKGDVRKVEEEENLGKGNNKEERIYCATVL